MFLGPVAEGFDARSHFLKQLSQRRQQRIADGNADVHHADLERLELLGGAFHALLEVGVEQPLVAGIHRALLDVLHLALVGNRRADERHGLHVLEQLAQLVGFRQALQRGLAFLIVLDGHRLLELAGGCRPLGLHVLRDDGQHGLHRRQPLGAQVHHAALEVDAGLLEVLERVRGGDLLQEVLEVVGRLIVRAGALAGDLQGGTDLGDGFLASHTERLEGRRQGREPLGHVADFKLAALARVGQHVERALEAFLADLEVVLQGDGHTAQVVHAGAGRRGRLGHDRGVILQRLRVLNATRHQHAEAPADLGLGLVPSGGRFADGTADPGLFGLGEFASNGDVPHLVLEAGCQAN